MKKSKRLDLYELHSGSYAIIPTRKRKKGKGFAQIEGGGQTCSKKITNEELGKLVRKWLDKSVWSES